MTEFKVGKVIHFYDKIGVAIVQLDGTLSVGDKIKFVRGGEDVSEETVESIQVEHQKLDTANKGDVIGLKVSKEIKEGAEVFKIN